METFILFFYLHFTQCFVFKNLAICADATLIYVLPCSSKILWCISWHETYFGQASLEINNKFLAETTKTQKKIKEKETKKKRFTS